MGLYPIEIGDQNCSTLLNLRSHSIVNSILRPAHSCAAGGAAAGAAGGAA
jgi:hypothetical protein